MNEREALQGMLALLEEDRNAAPALKGAVAFAVLRLVIIYLMTRVK